MRVEIKASTSKGKKMTAVFFDGDKKIKTTHFGSAGMSDFTKHKDAERKQRYIDRHKSAENWNAPQTAGALSRWVLWDRPTISAGVASYKKRFGLK